MLEKEKKRIAQHEKWWKTFALYRNRSNLLNRSELHTKMPVASDEEVSLLEFCDAAQTENGWKHMGRKLVEKCLEKTQRQNWRGWCTRIVI